MNIIIWLMLGYIIGWVAPDLLKKDLKPRLILDIFLGVIGAVIGGYITEAVIFNTVSGFSPVSLVSATLSALFFVNLGRTTSQI